VVQNGARGPNIVAYDFGFRSNIVRSICRLYKLTLSDPFQVTLQLILGPRIWERYFVPKCRGRNYHYMLRNSPEERSTQSFRFSVKFYLVCLCWGEGKFFFLGGGGGGHDSAFGGPFQTTPLHTEACRDLQFMARAPHVK
jgi:hypothetical protein